MRVVVTGGTVVNASGSQQADVVTEDGRIVGIVSPGSVTGELQVDAHGCYVIPGGVDPHVHFDSPTQKVPVADDFFTGTVAAAFGGTTTVIDFAFQLGGISLLEALAKAKTRAIDKAIVDYGFHVVLTKADDATLAELEVAVAAGASSCKLYMAYKARGLLLEDDEIFSIMRRARDAGMLVMLHAENGPITALFVKEAVEAGRTGPYWHAKSRPPLTEVEAIYRGITLAELAGSAVYFVHVSTEGGAEHIANARRRGRPVYGETCPHYLLLDETVYDAPGFEAAKWVLTPPIRDIGQQAALWRALSNRDLDTVATDHCPFCFEGGKDVGVNDFSAIPNGGPGIEHRVALTYDAGVASGRISVERWVELTSTAPARLFGLAPRKGSIAIGADADIVVFDPRAVSAITAVGSHSAVDYSMYEGRKLTGAVRTVMSRGDVIIHDGVLTAQAGRGSFVARNAHEQVP